MNSEKEEKKENGEIPNIKEAIPVVKENMEAYTYRNPNASPVEPVVVSQVIPSEVPQVEPKVEEPLVEKVIAPELTQVEVKQEEPKIVESEPQKVEVVEETPSKKSKGKPVLLILFFIFLLAFIIFLPEITSFIETQKAKPGITPTPPVATATPTAKPAISINLDMIVKAFNTNEDVIDIRSAAGNSLTAVAKNKEMIVTYQTKAGTKESHYKIEENVLITTDADSVTAPIVVEVVSQLQGNAKNSSKDIFDQDLSIYTLATDGIELSKKEEVYSLKIDLTKKMNVVDPNKVAIEVADLKANEEELLSDNAYSISKGNFYFVKEKTKTGYTIYLGEKIALSENMYTSLLSFVSFYQPNELENFKTAYPKLLTTKQTNGSITVSSEVDEGTKSIFERIGSYKIIKIEIKK